MKREEVYKLIDGERDYQTKVEHDSSRTEMVFDGVPRPHSVGEYMILLHYYLGKADEAWVMNAGDTAALDVIRKIAGISVHCMEDHDAPARGWHHG